MGEFLTDKDNGKNWRNQYIWLRSKFYQTKIGEISTFGIEVNFNSQSFDQVVKNWMENDEFLPGGKKIDGKLHF